MVHRWADSNWRGEVLQAGCSEAAEEPGPTKSGSIKSMR
jgi:hypothetical protein